MSNKCQYLEENQRFINIEDLLKTSIITKSTFFNIENICQQLFLDQFEIFTQKNTNKSYAVFQVICIVLPAGGGGGPSNFCLCGKKQAMAEWCEEKSQLASEWDNFGKKQNVINNVWK